MSIEHVAVVGAGRIGHGIALAYALDGRSVALYDVDEDVLASSRSRIASVLETFVEAGHVTRSEAETALGNVARADSFEGAVGDAGFVTEAVAEDIAVKRTVFERLDEHAPADSVLATNTSGLSIDDIAAPVSDPSRVLGTHWFNPPYVVPLVEIVKGTETTDTAVGAVRDLLDSAGKTPVVVQKDVPGFIGNRIQAAMSYEAFSLLARGVATPADIDKAVKAGFGFRLPLMGIFEKGDQSGLDIHHAVEKQLMADLDRGTDPNTVITELLAEGATGTDAGVGVYDWRGVNLPAVQDRRDQALLSTLELYESVDHDTPPANYDRT